MKDQKNSREGLGNEEYVKKVYFQIIFLGLLLHFLYVCLFGYIGCTRLMVYNGFSVAFYSVMLLVAARGHYRTAVTCIHLEISLFVMISTLATGWETGFPMFLIAICSLTYFCPYEKRYVPYLFALAEFVLFLVLRLVTIEGIAFTQPLSPQNQFIVYLCNAVSSVGTILFASFSSGVSALVTKRQLLDENESLSAMANYDQLTGLLSRYSILNQVGLLKQDKLVVAIGDIDNFKDINDSYGHPCGDYVLQTIAQILRRNADEEIQICRWGGEEFIFLFGDRDLTLVQKAMDQLLQAVASYQFCYEGKEFTVTMTVGVAHGTREDGFHNILQKADENLYRGKHRGKNQVVYGRWDIMEL